jgi:alpha-N-arabinofuranosidase
MQDTTIHLHSGFQIGQVDPRIFGGFLEHMGRAVYEGVYDPKSTHADEDGFRTDVLAALKRLRYAVMRYPGGNFASGYHWMDGVGPRDQRPTMRDLAWQSTEPNHIGTDEFMVLCRKMDWMPMLTINLGTGTPEEARNWVEYCNSPAGTRYADMRVANSSQEPYRVKLWCLGNEMDGPWQLGHVPADQYASRAQQAAKMMKDTDPTIEMVVCGSCTTDLPTYMEWDRQVLEYVGPYVDYISLHRYVGNENDDTPDFLAISNAIDQQIEEMDAACRYVHGKPQRLPRSGKRRVYLCFDEWNVWYRAREREHMDGQGKFAPHLIEEVYNLEDALVVAGFLNSFIRHADVLKIANIAQIVNVIAPILTQGDTMLIQSIFYPLEMYTKRRTGISLQPVVQGPTYEGKTNGQVTVIDASAILDAQALHVFAVNRGVDVPAVVQVDLADQEIAALGSAELLTGSDAKAANSFEQPDVVKAQLLDDVSITDGKATVELPPLSVAAMTFRL